MRILCIGGGPAGLYFALLAKRSDPTRAVRVIERNRPGDTFGAGAVLGGLLGAAGARGLAGAYNLARGSDATTVRWSAEFLTGRVAGAVLRYLAVAHLGVAAAITSRASIRSTGALWWMPRSARGARSSTSPGRQPKAARQRPRSSHDCGRSSS